MFGQQSGNGGTGLATRTIAAAGGNTEGGGSIRVKGASEAFSMARTKAVHAKTGRPVMLPGGGEAEGPSEWDKARAGAFLKFLGRKAGMNILWTEADASILAESVARDKWSGAIGGQQAEDIPAEHVKAILDDAGSGGAYISPAWFDALIITPALLTGELAPFVEMVNVPRGSSVEGGAISHPTLTWGTAEGTAETLFNTSQFLAEFNTTLHPVGVYVEVGNDFLSDAAVNVGTMLASLIGERMAAELDKIIAIGNGTTQPEGLQTASGTTVVPSVGGTSGPIAVGDLEALLFAVPKQYRNAANRVAFVMTDEGYRRARAVPVGASDARRVFGMDHQSYMILDTPARVQNDLTEGTMLCAALARYRLYSRQGMALRWTSEGQTLSLKNTSLLSCRARFGGKLTLGEACAKMTDAAQTG